MNQLNPETRYSNIIIEDDKVLRIYQKGKSVNYEKFNIEEVEQNQKQQQENKQHLIQSLKTMEKTSILRQENQFQFLQDLFQQNEKYLETLEKLFQKTILRGFLSKVDNEVDSQIQMIKDIDIKIQGETKMLYSNKQVQISLSKYDRVKNIMEKKYQVIQKLNQLILQKKKSVSVILQKLRSNEKAINPQFDQQKLEKIEEDIRQLELVKENVDKYFMKLNFHFDDKDILKQIEELKNIKKQYEDQNTKLNHTITKLEQELKNEKAQALNLITQLKQELQNEKDKAVDLGKKQKEYQENEKAKALNLITQLKQELQNEKDKAVDLGKKQKEYQENEKAKTLNLITQLKQELQNEKDKAVDVGKKYQTEQENEKAKATNQITQLKQELQNEKDKAVDLGKKQKEYQENEKAKTLNLITQLKQELQNEKNKAFVQEIKYQAELENEIAKATNSITQLKQELQNRQEQYESNRNQLFDQVLQLKSDLENQKNMTSDQEDKALILEEQFKQELQKEKGKVSEQQQRFKKELQIQNDNAQKLTNKYLQELQKEKDKAYYFEQQLAKNQGQNYRQESTANHEQIQKINVEMLKQLDQVRMQLMVNNTSSSKDEEKYLQIGSQLPKITFYQNLSCDNITIIQLFFNSSQSGTYSYFGLCDQNIDNSVIKSIQHNLAYPPKGVFFFLSMQGDLLIQDPYRKTKLKMGGFYQANNGVFIFDSLNNHLTIFKNYAEIESFKIKLPKNNCLVIPFILQAQEEEIKLRIA